jgi:hypothetical protein
MDPTAPWSSQDLLFLQDSLRRGSSLAEVAGFLARREDEVRHKAEELGLAVPGAWRQAHARDRDVR